MLNFSKLKTLSQKDIEVSGVGVEKIILKFCVIVFSKKLCFNDALFVPSLGSDHDGWFRGTQCDASNGYIMASISPLTTNGFYFSQCTINSIKTNLM